jgi:membrane protease YdiL (CAAX protease family)
MSPVDRRALAVFLLVAFGFTWSLHLAVYLGPGLASVPGTVLVALSMFGPALATFVVTRRVEREPQVARATGLVLGHHWKRYWVLALLGTAALILGALALSAALGLYQADLEHFSGLRAMLGAKVPAEAMAKLPPAGVLALALVAQGVFMGAIFNAPVAFGEEWGWRGWLLPRLQVLGRWQGLLLHGVIWGLWHAPVIVQGHNYPKHPVLGVLMMVVFCVLLGALLGWTRLATGSIWPAVLSHGVLNGLGGGVVAIFGEAGAPVDMAQVGVLGWPGWLLMAGLIALLVLTRRLPGPTARGDKAPAPSALTPAA